MVLKVNTQEISKYICWYILKFLQPSVFYPHRTCNSPNILNIYKALQALKGIWVGNFIVVVSKRRYKEENVFHIHLNGADAY